MRFEVKNIANFEMKKAGLSKTQGIGLFVVIILIAIYLVINFLKGQDLFSSRNVFYTSFENVEGLSETGPVYIRGLKVGMIEKIAYNPVKDNFTVEFNVKSEYAIPKGSVAEVYSSDILGSKSLRICLGKDNIHAQDGDTLKGGIAPDMISMLTGQIGPISEQVSTLMDNLNTALNSINSILDSNGQANISQTLANLNKTMDNAEGITANLNSLSPEIKSLVENLSSFSASLESGSGDITASLDNLNKITTSLSEADLQATVNNLKALLEKMQDPNGSIGKLLATDSLHNSADTLIKSINTFVEKMTENPKKFIKISVF